MFRNWRIRNLFGWMKLSSLRHWEAPRWLNLTTVLVGITCLALVGGGISGWMLRGALTADGDASAAAASPSELPKSELRMPDVRGLTENDARQVMVDAGFDPSIVSVTQTPSVATPGTVIAQSPVARTTNPGTITLSIPSPAQMPDLMGKNLEEASKVLSGMGATPSIKRVYKPGATSGVVIGMEPVAGLALTINPILTVADSPDDAPLSDLRSNGGCSSNVNSSVNGTKITNGINCSVNMGTTKTYWIINRAAERLKALLGLDDKSGTEIAATVKILGDGKELYSKEFHYGQSEKLDLDVAGFLRLELIVEQTSKSGLTSYSSSNLILGNAVLSGASEALATIESSK